jgi:uncharacterized protein HemY
MTNGGVKVGQIEIQCNTLYLEMDVPNRDSKLIIIIIIIILKKWWLEWLLEWPNHPSFFKEKKKDKLVSRSGRPFPR